MQQLKLDKLLHLVRFSVCREEVEEPQEHREGTSTADREISLAVPQAQANTKAKFPRSASPFIDTKRKLEQRHYLKSNQTAYQNDEGPLPLVLAAAKDNASAFASRDKR